MPPVLAPRPPSKIRLKSCAGCSARAVRPSQTAKSETSGPSRNSSITTRSQVAACASASSREVVTTTPLPAASASSLTTYGEPSSSRAAAASSGVAQTRDRAVGTPAAAITSLLKAFEPSSCAAAPDGPKTAIARGPDGVGDPGHERRLGADDHQVDAERRRQGRHRLTVHRVDVVQGRDLRRCRGCRVRHGPR